MISWPRSLFYFVHFLFGHCLSIFSYAMCLPTYGCVKFLTVLLKAANFSAFYFGRSPEKRCKKSGRCQWPHFRDINVLHCNFWICTWDTQKILSPNNDMERAVSKEDFKVQLESPHFYLCMDLPWAHIRGVSGKSSYNRQNGQELCGKRNGWKSSATALLISCCSLSHEGLWTKMLLLRFSLESNWGKPCAGVFVQFLVSLQVCKTSSCAFLFIFNF